MYLNTDFYNNLLLTTKLVNARRSMMKQDIKDRVGNIESGGTIVKNDRLSPFKQKGSQRLYSWIKQQLLNSAENFVNFSPNDIVLEYSWVNIMNNGSQVKVHKHHDSFDCVGIFYVRCPGPGTGMLTLINQNSVFPYCSDNRLLDEYPNDAKHTIASKSGDLIIHAPDVLHGVSVHNVNQPRISIIMDVKFV